MAFLNLFLIHFIITQNINAEHWNYDLYGPDYWKTKWINCAGHQQSPINILTDSVTYNDQLKNIVFKNYDHVIYWNFTNNGETIRAIPNVLGTRPSILLDETSYTLSQFHFHWGFNDYQGSEHLIDFEKFPLEIHLVHTSHENRTAVLAFLFQLTTFVNSNLTQLQITANFLTSPNSYKQLRISLNSFLPSEQALAKEGYFRYNGSLTTPPCDENILWTVFKTKINIASQQLIPFRKNSRLANFRDFQPLYDRHVYTNVKNNSPSYETNFKILYTPLFISIFIVIINIYNL